MRSSAKKLEGEVVREVLLRNGSRYRFEPVRNGQRERKRRGDVGVLHLLTSFQGPECKLKTERPGPPFKVGVEELVTVDRVSEEEAQYKILMLEDGNHVAINLNSREQPQTEGT